MAVFDTSMGTLRCTLFPDAAPITVGNFVGLATGRIPVPVREGPLYNNTVFHRVIPEFMIQGGDPDGVGSGGPGYRFLDEIDPELRFDRPGRLAMANAGPGTNGSQFFVTEVPTPHLDGKHTIFGQCDEASLELVKAMARVPAGPGNKPQEDIVLDSITFE